VATSSHIVRGPEGAPPVELIAYRPLATEGRLPCILHIHGGGFVGGRADAQAGVHQALALELDCAIITVEYRLAPETPFPGAVEDCYACLAWLFEQPEAVGVDLERVGVMGESAGGGLAAALALLARDRGEYPLAFQHLLYPMLDDRTSAGLSLDPYPYAGEFIWTHHNNRYGWRSLLGAEPGSEGVSPYAAPARAKSLVGLPPTFLFTGALDLFIEEDMDFARPPYTCRRSCGAARVSGCLPRVRRRPRCGRLEPGASRQPRRLEAGAAPSPRHVRRPVQPKTRPHREDRGGSGPLCFRHYKLLEAFMSEWTYADIWEEIAAVVPHRPALIQGDRVVSWGDFDARANALSAFLLEAGLGHQSKMNAFLYNSPEYLESYYAAFRPDWSRSTPTIAMATRS